MWKRHPSHVPSGQDEGNSTLVSFLAGSQRKMRVASGVTLLLSLSSLSCSGGPGCSLRGMPRTNHPHYNYNLRTIHVARLAQFVAGLPCMEKVEESTFFENVLAIEFINEEIHRIYHNENFFTRQELLLFCQADDVLIIFQMQKVYVHGSRKFYRTAMCIVVCLDTYRVTAVRLCPVTY
uniref:Uncharacterized protein n=1 Tax=Romanomermis culicivorax TaxID=13658 RepID=A0A915JKD7_ROMCU